MGKVLALCLLLIFSSSTALALNTQYNNKGGYNNKSGYNNQIPYSAFFNGHGPKQEQLKVQVNVKGNKVQGVINVNTKEEKVEQQGIKD